jgi:pyruvate carboxylase subunit B
LARKLLIRDTTLRDGHQSLFATRMNQAQVDRVLPIYKDAGFYAMEVWGGAVPDSVMRYLNESPWARLEKIHQAVGQASKLTALSRGRNLFGYSPYPDEVIEGFCRNAVRSGIDIMRIFDALNDVDNMKSTIRFVKQYGGMTDCAICYTVDPRYTLADKLKALFSGKRFPRRVFSIDYFVGKARELAGLGADMVTIKDMAGLIDPRATGRLIRALKRDLEIPINLHTHCTPGYGVASTLMAMVNDVDVVDCNALTFSGGPAGPAVEIVLLLADKLAIETTVNREALAAIDRELRGIRGELGPFDKFKRLPPVFDLTRDKLPAEVDGLFDRAVEAARAGKAGALLPICHRIEAFFNYPEPNQAVGKAQIPGGMYSNMLAQLEQMGMSDLLNQVIRMVPRVRADSGLPPLVTPTSQIVGVQAVNCVVDRSRGNPLYTTTATQFVNLVKGEYGKTPAPVDPDFREKIAGVREEVPYDTGRYQKPENPVLREYGDVRLAQNEREELLLDLFPSVAHRFLEGQRKREYAESPGEPDEFDREIWEYLSIIR